MKTREEIDALREEVAELNKKLAELTDDELNEVAGGEELTGYTDFLRKMGKALKDINKFMG